MRAFASYLGLCALLALFAGSASAATTTLGPSSNPATSATVCPGVTWKTLHSFSLVNDVGTNPVTGLTVSLTNYSAVQSIFINPIVASFGGTQYFQTINPPTSNTLAFSGNNSLPVQQTYAINVKVVVSYKDRGSAPPGLTTTTAYVKDFTTKNIPEGKDLPEATLTLDNSTKEVGSTWGTITATDGRVDLSWTIGTPGNSVVIARYFNNTDPTIPDDGKTYTKNASIESGVGVVVYVGNDLSFTDSETINGNTYYYRIFEYNSCMNYANTPSTAPWTSPVTPRQHGTTQCSFGICTLTCDPGYAAPANGCEACAEGYFDDAAPSVTCIPCDQDEHCGPQCVSCARDGLICIDKRCVLRPNADVDAGVGPDSGRPDADTELPDSGREDPRDPYSLIGCGCVAGSTSVGPLAILGLVGSLTLPFRWRSRSSPGPSSWDSPADNNSIQDDATSRRGSSMRAPIFFHGLWGFFSGPAIARRLSALCSVGIMVAAVGCASSPGEAGTVTQAVGTPPASMVSCASDAPCTMPLIAAGSSHTIAV